MTKAKTTNIKPSADSGTETAPSKPVRWGRRELEFSEFTAAVKSHRLSGSYKPSPFISALCRLDNVVREGRSNSSANLLVVTQILVAIGVPFPADGKNGRNEDCKPNLKSYIAARIWTAINRPAMLKCEINEHDSGVLTKLAAKFWQAADKNAASEAA